MRGCGIRWIGIAVLAALLLIPAAPLHAESLTTTEHAALARGEVVKREVTAELADGRYVGGVAYAIVHAAPETVMAALLDVSAYRHMLPMTLDADFVGRRGRDVLVALRHGGKLGSAGYTCRVRRESNRLVRFWLDPTEPHDVDDVWGFFRVEPFGKDATLLTYGAAVNLGPGITRLLFEERVRTQALRTPDLVRRYVERQLAQAAPGRLARAGTSP